MIACKSKCFYISTMVNLGLLIGCTDTSPVIDKCKGAIKTDASFKMYEYVEMYDQDRKTWPYYDTDTSAVLSMLFVANDSTANSYKWEIGSEVYNTRKLLLYFPRYLIGGSIPITLSISRTPNLSCFPEDKGVDSTTRTLTLVDRCKSLVNGIFFGKSTSTNDTVSITLDVCRYLSLQQQQEIYIFNLQRNCGKFYSDASSVVAYRQALFSSINVGCNGASGIAYLPKGKSDVELDYYLLDDLQTLKSSKYKFIGKKIK